MNRYKIYQSPYNSLDTVAVKEGFSWTAFFFGGMWALFSKLWLIGGIYCGVMLFFRALLLILMYHMNIVPLYWIFMFIFVIALVLLGIFGNSLKENNLKSKGYVLAKSLMAKDNIDALILYHALKHHAFKTGGNNETV